VVFGWMAPELRVRRDAILRLRSREMIVVFEECLINDSEGPLSDEFVGTSWNDSTDVDCLVMLKIEKY